MGRKRVWILATVILIMMSAVLALYVGMEILQEDRTPPVIEIEQENLEISVTFTQEDLLQGVTARDRRDGDVTDRIVVEQMANITPERTAKVTYAAFDHSGNVKKASRTVTFTDYEPPRFHQRRALVMPEGGNQDLLGFMGAGDLIDGDLSDYIKGSLISDTTSLSQAGAHQVEFRVTNSMGDTARIVLPVDVYPSSTYNASVELSEYLIYLPQGGSFRPEEYLHSLKVGSLSYSLTGNDPEIWIYINENGASLAKHVVRVDMNSDVNPDEPGIYSVTYTVTMDDQYTGFTRLNVVVEG